MEILEGINLRMLNIDPTQKFIVEYIGTAVEIKGLFNTHVTNAVKENIQQMICSTAKQWFEN